MTNYTRRFLNGIHKRIQPIQIKFPTTTKNRRTISTIEQLSQFNQYLTNIWWILDILLRIIANNKDISF